MCLARMLLYAGVSGYKLRSPDSVAIKDSGTRAPLKLP